MEEIAKWGTIAGLAGLVAAAMFRLFRQFFLARIFPKLKPKQAARIITLIVVISGILTFFCAYEYFQLKKEADSVTIYVHSPKSPDELVIPGRGEVVLIYGTAFVDRPTDKNGQAIFNEVPSSFFDPDSRVEIRFVDPLKQHYHELYPDSPYKLAKGKYISLIAKLFNLDSIYGKVKDFATGQPIDSANIRIWGANTYSNKYGEYVLKIPENAQKDSQTVSVYKSGYDVYEETVPVETETPMPIELKRTRK